MAVAGEVHVAKKLGYNVKELQFDVVQKIVLVHDVFAVLSTGFGKDYDSSLSEQDTTIDQDIRLCVVRPSSDTRDTVYFTRTNFTRFHLFIAQKYWAYFNQNHVLDALQSRYLTYQI